MAKKDEKTTEKEEVKNGQEAEAKTEKVMKPVCDAFGCFVRWE